MIDQPKLKLLCEAFHVINNANGQANDIIDYINKYLRAEPRGDYWFAKVDGNIVQNGNLVELDFDVTIPSVPGLKTIQIKFRDVYKEEDYIKEYGSSRNGSAAILFKGETAWNNSNRTTWTSTIVVTLLIYIFDKGRDTWMCYRTDKLKGLLRHELTHNVQQRKNNKRYSVSDSNRFSDPYRNTQKGVRAGTLDVKIISFYLYKLFPTEVDAEVNRLVHELQEASTDRSNWQENLQNSAVYRQWKQSKDGCMEVFNDPSTDWAEVLKIFKEYGILERGVVETDDPKVFKNRLFKYISKMGNRAVEKFNNAIAHAVAYSGKPENDKSIANNRKGRPS